MKRNRRRNQRTAIVKAERRSVLRKVAVRATSFAATKCLGVGFEELVKWAWEEVKLLF